MYLKQLLMANIVEFLFEKNPIRTLYLNGEPFFVAKDICDILEYKNSRKAIDDNCNPKGVTLGYVPTKGGNQQAILINEPNLYRLIAKSRMEKAKVFEEWIYETVLPTIRKTGSYSLKETPTKLELPYYYRRYVENFHKVPKGYFSILAEAVILVIEPLQTAGATEKELDKLYPDISQGRMFKSFLLDKGIDVNSYPKYNYKRPNDEKTYECQCYPNELLGEFRNWVLDFWIPKQSQIYFKNNQPHLLQYAPKLLGK
jgi:prophage antirepressor-like protein